MEKLTGIAIVKPGNIGVYRKGKDGQLFGVQAEDSIEGIDDLIGVLKDRRIGLEPKPAGDVV